MYLPKSRRTKVSYKGEKSNGCLRPPKDTNALKKIRNTPFEVEMQLTFYFIISPFRSYFKNILRLLGF